MKISLINTSFGQGRYVNDPKIIAELYYATDIYLFPTLVEIFETTVVEAISCGLPVITFETSGVPEIVENEQSGLLVEYKKFIKKQELAPQVNIVLNNKE